MLISFYSEIKVLSSSGFQISCFVTNVISWYLVFSSFLLGIQLDDLLVHPWKEHPKLKLAYVHISSMPTKY